MRVSGEGLIRLCIDELLSIPLRHCFSGVDEACADSVSGCGRIATISGYTEWTSSAAPSLSFGWDWQLDVHDGGIRWRRIDVPRTNVLLVDSRGRDLDWGRSLSYLSTVVDSLPWVKSVAQCVCETRV
ncbi:DUF4902 domain-containing protein [Ideonella sp. DXS29W]|uniref:DUF4902 domain-containing protein n=1 Tax=Ideonella lacteola TaxID=2984193 RepID=A0ABU9C117_9BURK